MAFLDDVWYCAALATEIGDAPLGRTIAEKPIVFFRTAGGALAALEDRCCHRQAPLSLGRVLAETIECAYHGFTFDGTGRCTHIPHQPVVPPAARIGAYPVVERWGLVWLWIGRPEAADPARIPRMPWTADPGQRAVFFNFPVKANFQLMADNLMDVSHTDFLHRASIGSQTGRAGADDETRVELECAVEGDTVRFVRRVHNTLLGPVATKWAGSTKQVRRTNYLLWEPPNTIHSVLEFVNDETHHTIHLDHIMTPETRSTTHYFMPWVRDFGLDNVAYPTDDDVRNEQNMVVLGDDVPMVEAQQRNIERFGIIPDLPAKQDRFVVTVHKRLAELYARNGKPVPAELSRLKGALQAS